MKGVKYMTVLDANQGYFQLELDDKSKNYAAFVTPFGRYRYKTLPMGITSAPELFMRAFGDIFGDIEGLEMIMDDFLIIGSTLEEYNKTLKQVLQRAKENHITFNIKKVQTKKWFSVHGIPEQVTSGLPFNSSEWKHFAESYNFVHKTSSPEHPQANGMVEKYVGIAKKMLIKCNETRSDPYLALLNIRNTPRDENTRSPVQRLFSRRTRTIIPTSVEKLKPQVKQ
ncbi:uncharacterized protein LOC106181177 [Lingula anatina]|uniref:Uncharacterized protein LOC106181177 n=1 Tax=Lingula anatina TaxID=7574 RepID=A0A1S3KE85_LINAN|nr:uncharacterized protein LOC106181177 [Lingula anatina]|eukprot:XP_013420938.1 uncharacterized protein LOC106181177 [Lingula anatina]